LAIKSNSDHSEIVCHFFHILRSSSRIIIVYENTKRFLIVFALIWSLIVLEFFVPEILSCHYENKHVGPVQHIVESKECWNKKQVSKEGAFVLGIE
jgi:hypothetical protein